MIQMINNPSIMILFQLGKTDELECFNDEKSKELLRLLQPQNLIDLLNIYCLNREGIENNLNVFIKNKLIPKNINYLHSLMENSLKDTSGILIYEEQFVDIVKQLAGLSHQESEDIRKALATKQAELIKEYFKKFHDGCMSNEMFLQEYRYKGHPLTAINNIWEYLFHHSTKIIKMSYALKFVINNYITASEKQTKIK